YFALPPARAEFCNVALSMANEYQTAPPEDPKLLAATYLPRIEAAFDKFFREYEQYRIDSAAWDARYGAQYGASQPGYVAVHGVGAPTLATTLTTVGAPQRVGGVVDPQTGARIPLIALPEETVQRPVVQLVYVRESASDQ